jgi:hypothetical protein
MILHATALNQKTIPGPGILECFKQEYFNCPAATWTNICNLNDGPKLVTNLWFATSSGGRTLPIRIIFDGHDPATPDIIGFTGELFASGYDNDVHFRNNFIGVSRGESAAFSGFLKLLMPYYSSIRIDVYGGSSCWFMLERMSVTKSGLKKIGIIPGMYLKTYGYGQAGQKTRYSEVTLLETSTPTILAGHFQMNSNDSAGPDFWSYLEGNYKIHYPSSLYYESSGTEDFYHSSWYFNEGQFAVDDECMAYKSPGSNYKCIMSRFFPLWRAPFGITGIKFTWNVGESGHGDPGNSIYLRWITWFYK